MLGLFTIILLPVLGIAMMWLVMNAAGAVALGFLPVFLAIYIAEKCYEMHKHNLELENKDVYDSEE